MSELLGDVATRRMFFGNSLQGVAKLTGSVELLVCHELGKVFQFIKQVSDLSSGALVGLMPGAGDQRLQGVQCRFELVGANHGLFPIMPWGGVHQ